MSVFATTLSGAFLINYSLFIFFFKGKVFKGTVSIYYRGTSPRWSKEGRC